MTAKEILLKAAEDFEREPHTWIQGFHRQRRKGVTCYCLAGKIRSLQPDDCHEALGALCGPIRSSCVTWWNDLPGRTVQDVILACRKAAEAA